ncbi:MAG: sulfur carrier protein ThiS [Desulfitobacteriaceae bacterium]
MRIVVNGELQEEVSPECTVLKLLEEKAVVIKTAVVELNGEILEQEQWQSVILQADDNLEILVFMGGG